MFYPEIVQDGSCLICIKDNDTVKSTFLVKDFIKGHVAQEGNVHIYCYDRSINQSTQFYGSSDKHRYYNYISENIAECFRSTDNSNAITWDSMNKPYNFLSSLKPDSSDRCYTIIIDSLSGLLVHQEFASLFQQLHKLVNQKIFKYVFSIQILAVIHEDALEDSHLVIEHLKHLAKVWINMKANNTVEISTKRENGKFDSKEYIYTIDKDGNTTLGIESTKFTGRPKETSVEPVSTFNLKLTEAEKCARDNVQLPYTKHKNDTLLLNDNEENTTIGKGHILYVPDENDWYSSDEDADY